MSKGIVHELRHGLLTHLARQFGNRSCLNSVKKFRQKHRHEHRRRTFDTDGNRQMCQNCSWSFLRHDLNFIWIVLRDEHRRRTFDTDGNRQMCQNHSWSFLPSSRSLIWIVFRLQSVAYLYLIQYYELISITNKNRYNVPLRLLYKFPLHFKLAN